MWTTYQQQYASIFGIKDNVPNTAPAAAAAFNGHIGMPESSQRNEPDVCANLQRTV
jgi:CxxC motif-containing protein (DUF1111 family)